MKKANECKTVNSTKADPNFILLLLLLLTR